MIQLNKMFYIFEEDFITKTKKLINKFDTKENCLNEIAELIKNSNFENSIEDVFEVYEDDDASWLDYLGYHPEPSLIKKYTCVKFVLQKDLSSILIEKLANNKNYPLKRLKKLIL